ncbi:MAG: hypothetical protein JWQ79_2018 [Mucilaginibacter sp.]|nr:hypothetical protein [Mucilaginibacter sp.]
MYKNVSNQHIIALVLLFSSCFSAIRLNAQAISANSAIAVNTNNIGNDKTAHPPNADVLTPTHPEIDTTWKPVRRMWGLVFGDLYYNAHADAGNRGAETNYNSVPTYRNAFQFRRIYLGYDYDIDRKFSVELLLASEPSANTNVSGTTAISNSDNLADNKMSFYIKLFNLRWKSVWKGTDLVIGESLTPVTVMLTEKIWGYRFIEKTIADAHKNNLYDVGAALQGVFDPGRQNFGYNVMVGNNTQASLLSAANANTGFYKAFYGDVYAKFINKTLIFDLYADYMQTATATATLGAQAHNMVKGMAAYTVPKITFGIEAYTQSIKNGVTNTTTNSSANANVEAISVYAHGPIYKDKLGFFARYDSYNPDDGFNAVDIYTVNTNLASYSPFTKEHFYTAGLDFTPAKNVHFSPNIWFMQYKDQRDASTTGYLPDSHVLVYRATFFVQFGK